MIDNKSDHLQPQLRPRVTCPHCWNNFAPEETLWIAAHPDLQNDLRVGEGEGQRFLPTRYNVAGNAIDARGTDCQDLACPQCHLRIPKSLLELPPVFVSIAGTPSCGKTYLLAAMTWRLRRTLPKQFAMTFADADPVSNAILNEYEDQQFFNDKPDEIVKLDKTQVVSDDLYYTVNYGDQEVRYPRPFLFAIRPGDQHPNIGRASDISHLICLYDNAGESFEPGADDASSPVTRHLAQAQVLMYCFDPTQDPRLRNDCRTTSSDPQVKLSLETRRQESIFHEMVDRVRKFTGLSQNQKHNRGLVVIVTKYDVWWKLLGDEKLKPPWLNLEDQPFGALDMPTIDKISAKVRSILWEYSPEIVSAAEAFSQQVMYIPASATGCSPETEWDEEGKEHVITGIRPRDINPIWAEVPLLVALARWGHGMIPYARKKTQQTDGAKSDVDRQDTEYAYPPTPETPTDPMDDKR